MYLVSTRTCLHTHANTHNLLIFLLCLFNRKTARRKNDVLNKSMGGSSYSANDGHKVKNLWTTGDPALFVPHRRIKAHIQLRR